MFGQSDFSASAMPGRAEPAGVAQSQPLRGESWSPSVVAESAEVLANDEVNKEYRHLVVRCGDVSASAAPGQFFQLLCPQTGGEQPFLRRPMSLYGADPERRQVEVLYKIAGAGTRGLAVLRAGDQLDILGPLGTGFKLDPSLRHIAAIGRGAGLATLAPLAKAAKANGTSVTAIFSARRPELLVSVDLFRRQGAEVIAVTDSESTGRPISSGSCAASSPTDGVKHSSPAGRAACCACSSGWRGNSTYRARSPWSSKWPAVSDCAFAACATSTSAARSFTAGCAGMGRSST